MVIEITVAFNKTVVPHAVALEVELETRSNLSYILPIMLVWRISLIKFPKGIEKQCYQATRLTELQLLCLGYNHLIWTFSKILAV